MKKSLLIFGTILFLVLISSLFFSSPENPTQNQTEENYIPTLGVEGLTDTDGDSLKDWEEVLWKTDPNNPDTDGDGVLDGEEVRKLQEQELKLGVETGTGELTPTLEPTRPTSKEPIQKENPTENSLKKYGNELGVHISNQSQKNSAELAVWNAFIKDPSEEGVAQLKLIASSYNSLSETLLKLQIPVEALTLNTALALSYKDVSEKISTIAETKGVSGTYEKYSDAVKNSTNALIKIILFFQNNNIKFGPTEPGFIFMINL